MHELPLICFERLNDATRHFITTRRASAHCISANLVQAGSAILGFLGQEHIYIYWVFGSSTYIICEFWGQAHIQQFRRFKTPSLGDRIDTISYRQHGASHTVDLVASRVFDDNNAKVCRPLLAPKGSPPFSSPAFEIWTHQTCRLRVDLQTPFKVAGAS